MGYLYYEGVTAGCGGNNFCPTQALGSWQMLAWAQKIWPSYNPLPRASIVTYRDEGARVATEGVQSGSGDASAVEAYQRDNIFLGGQLASSGVWSGSGWTTLNYQFYAVDHLGSTRLVTDVTATSVQTLKYWPYGDDGPGTGSDAGQRLKFAGMERDSENKHYFDHARTQDFNLGRFVSADRVFGSPEAPQSWNRYSYVLNQPTSLTDPWGFSPPFCYSVPKANGDGDDVICRPTENPDTPAAAPNNEEGGSGDKFLRCVARTAEAHSIQGGIQAVSGGRLGNSPLSSALFGNSFAAFINVYENNRKNLWGAVKGTAPELATMVGSKGLEGGARGWSSLRIVTDTTTTVAVLTPNGVSVSSMDTTVAERLPFTETFEATAGLVTDFLEFKGWFDLGVAAIAAANCAMHP